MIFSLYLSQLGFIELLQFQVDLIFWQLLLNIFFYSSVCLSLLSLSAKALFIFCIFIHSLDLQIFIDPPSSSSTFFSAFSSLLLNRFSKIFTSIVFFSSGLSILLQFLFLCSNCPPIFSHHDHASPFRSLYILQLLSSLLILLILGPAIILGSMVMTSHFPNSSHVQQLSIINWVLWTLCSRDIFS